MGLSTPTQQLLGGLSETGLGLAAVFTEAQAERDRSRFVRNQLAEQARFSELAAQDALRRGRTEEIAIEQEKRQAIGATRAQLAAQGIEISTGTAESLQEDLARAFGRESATVRSNAMRQVLGHRLETAAFLERAAFERAESATRRRTTLATGGLAAVRDVRKLFSAFEERKKKDIARQEISRRNLSRAAEGVAGAFLGPGGALAVRAGERARRRRR